MTRRKGGAFPHIVAAKPHWIAFSIAAKPHWLTFCVTAKPHWIAFSIAAKPHWLTFCVTAKPHWIAFSIAAKPHWLTFCVAAKPHWIAFSVAAFPRSAVCCLLTTHSARNASIGSSRAARQAGQSPLMIPTTDETPTPSTAEATLIKSGKPINAAIR